MFKIMQVHLKVVANKENTLKKREKEGKFS